MNVVAKRYVQALFKSARNDDEIDKYKEYLQKITELFCSNSEFKKVLKNPCVSDKEKLNMIKNIIPEIIGNDTFINFINLVLKEKRIDTIESICEEFEKLINIKKGILDIKIVVASEISTECINKIVDKYKKLYNANDVNYTVLENKEIIGGIKVFVGNTVYDDSIKTKLKNIF